MKKIIYCLLISLLIISCRSKVKNAYDLQCKHVTFTDSISLEGEKMDFGDVIGIEDISIKDSIMILSTYKDNELYKIYSLNTNKHIGSFVTKGKSNNELVSPSYILNFNDTSDDIIFSVYDYGREKICNFNISKSIKQQKSNMIIDNTKFSVGMLTARYKIRNTKYLLRYQSYKDQSIHIGIIDTEKNKLLRDKKILNCDAEYSFFMISSINSLSFKKEKFISAMMFLDYIYFYNIKSPSKSFKITTSDKVRSLEYADRIRMDKKMEYYDDVKSTEKYVYALYVNANKKDWALNDIHTTVQVFDFDGKPIVNFQLDKKINDIAIDPEDKYIYGLCESNDSVYKYKINLANFN